MAVSWCDKLASTPAIGVRLDWEILPSGSPLAYLNYIMQPLATDDKQDFSIDASDATSALITTNDGFQYNITPALVSVTFNHRIRYRFSASGLPFMETLSRAQPYTRLLPEISGKLIDLAISLPNSSRRHFDRVGVVSNTVAGIDELPPGIRSFIAYLGAPWNHRLPAFNAQIVTELFDNEEYTDRCIHQLIRIDKAEDDLVTLRFDWQRTFKRRKTIVRNLLTEIAQRAQVDALAYFEKLGEGSMFDEQVNRSKDIG